MTAVSQHKNLRGEIRAVVEEAWSVSGQRPTVPDLDVVSRSADSKYILLCLTVTLDVPQTAKVQQNEIITTAKWNREV